MKNFFAKHSALFSVVGAFLLTVSATAGTRCIGWVWHDEPEAPAFMKNEWENN